MPLYRRVIGVSLVAVGLGLTFVAVYLIAHTGGKSTYMVAWGLGLLTMMLGLKSLPKKKQHWKSRDQTPKDNRMSDE